MTNRLTGSAPELLNDICKVEVGFMVFKLPVVSSG